MFRVAVFSRPSGTFVRLVFVPSDKSLGYSQSSLRDGEALAALAAAQRARPSMSRPKPKQPAPPQIDVEAQRMLDILFAAPGEEAVKHHHCAYERKHQSHRQTKIEHGSTSQNSVQFYQKI